MTKRLRQHECLLEAATTASEISRFVPSKIPGGGAVEQIRVDGQGRGFIDLLSTFQRFETES
jgi:hypothetical protein